MDFRQYDPAIGRFSGIDLLAESSYNLTPYHFSNNNPIIFSDPSGLKPKQVKNSEAWNEPFPTYNAPKGGVLYNMSNGVSAMGMHEALANDSGFMFHNPFSGGGGGSTSSIINNLYDLAPQNGSLNANFRRNSKGFYYIYTTAEFGPEREFSGVNEINSLGEIHLNYHKVYVKEDNWATATLAFIAADASIPEASDAYWPKWAGHAVAGIAASAFLYSGDYIKKMQKEIAKINLRVAGPRGFAYELVATKNGYYKNLNTGGVTLLNKGDVWKFGITTKGVDGRYPDSKVDLVRDNLQMIPLPPGGSQLEILIQEKYLIYGHFFLHGERPPGNPIFR